MRAPEKSGVAQRLLQAYEEEHLADNARSFHDIRPLPLPTERRVQWRVKNARPSPF